MNIAMFHTLDTIETLGLCMSHFQLITKIVKCKSSYEDDIPQHKIQVYLVFTKYS